jgi:AcrR family transcriptional regulator
VGRGLSPRVVVDAAGQLADSRGIDQLTLGALAEELGVRTPSLYNHVAGLPGLRRELALRGLHELAEALRDAAVGVAGEPALVALANAHRVYARTRPGLYAAAQRAPGVDDPPLRAAAETALHPLLAVLRGYGLDGEAGIHAARAVRSALHGFAELERIGGFGIDLDPDDSFRDLVGMLSAGLRERAAAAA